MIFVFITMACNLPNVIYGVRDSLEEKNFKVLREDIFAFKSQKGIDICSDKNFKASVKSKVEFWFDQLMFIQVYFILFTILGDPFTLKYLKQNIFTCNYIKLILCGSRLKSIRIKKQKNLEANLQQYFQKSLNFEIVYTCLNGVSQAIINIDSKKTMLHVKSKKEIKKIKKLVEKRRSSTGVWNDDLDFYNETIFRMNNQQVKNLNELDDYEVFCDSDQILEATPNIRRSKVN